MITTIRLRSKIAFLSFFLLLIGNIQTIKAQITVSGQSSATSIPTNTATAVEPSLTVTASENITDFTVSIIDSYSTNDQLSYSGSLPTGITVTPWSTTTRSIIFNGTTTAAEWQTFLRTVTITTGAVCSPETRQVSFAAGETYYNPLNGHFYRLTASQDSWTNSQNTASSTSYYGREGYLVTLTSDAENTFVTRLVGQNSWMGASDDFTQINEALGYTAYANQSASEGNFFWVTGPEQGTQLTTGNGNGTGVPGVYQNWRNNEPNNSGTEHYGHVYATAGDWNDFPNSINILGIIEFGEMPNDVTTAAPQFSKNISIQGAPSGSISGGDVTVCEGTNSTNLTLNGLIGTVVRWESSTNNFITAGTPIANTTTSLTVTNISESTYYRAVVNSTTPSACNGLVTSSTPIYVSELNTGNVLAENSTICAGADVELTVSGQTGTVQKWQRSTDDTNWTDIANTTTTLNETVASAGTVYYRAVIEILSCGTSQASPSREITVVSGTPPVGGQVSSATHIAATNSGSLTLTGHTGTVVKWQQSTDNGIIWNDIANTNTTYNYTDVAANTLFRAQLTNGSCGNAFSVEGSVLILDSPSITSFTPNLAGNGEVVTITGTGFTGTTAITFGGTNAASFTIVSDTEITATVGTGSSGSIVVTNPAGNDTETGFIYKVAQYDFENDVLDETDNNHDGTEVNTVAYETGAQGQAICFDNGPGYVSLPDNLIRNLPQFTISLRFKTTGTGAILGYQNTATLANASNWIPILMLTDDGRLKGTLWTSTNTSIQAVSTDPVNDGNWHQVDFTASSNTVTIYLDGTIEATTTGASVNHLDMSFNQLGLAKTNGYNNGVTDWEYFTGCIDDMVIIDKALTAQELEDVTALPEPTIVSFTPTNAGEEDTVVITGTNFDGATQVTFGGIDAASYTVDSATQITAVIDNGATGDVAVTTAGGTAAANGFTFNPDSFTLSETSLTLNENADTNTFTVVLDTEPTSNVVFDISSNDTDEATVSSAQLIFTAANWDTPQTVTVTGVNDDIDRDDSATITIAVNDASSDDPFDALANQTVAINITDDDNATYTLSETTLTVAENAGTNTFTVVLDTEPTSDVVFDISSNDINETTVDSAQLTFTSANWDTPQTATVTGVNDDIDRDDSATITIAVNDAGSDDTFDALVNQTVAVTLTDDDSAAYTLSTTTLTVAENAGTNTFTVVLDAEPTSDVVFDLSSNDTDEATLDSAQLTFTSANWDTPQTVTVTGVNDDIDRDDSATITIAVNDAGSDDTFDALANQTIAVTLTDDDSAAYTVSETTLTIDENAGTDTFTIVLDSEPTSDVVLDVSSDDIGEATLDISQITFTATNWNTPQSVTVTGIDDSIVADDTAVITVSINDAGSADEYDALADQAVAVTLTNDDVAVINISSGGITTTGITIDENGGTGVFSVELGAAPLSDVVIDFGSNDTNEATVSPASLTFTSANWDTPQTVTVTGVNDDIDKDDATTITISINDALSDDAYDGVPDETAPITITDDDSAAFTLSETTLTIDENAGTDTFTIVLDSEPTSDVVLDISSDDTNEATIDLAQLTFTSANWDIPQTITVLGVNDNMDGDDSVTITIAVNDVSSDNNFDALANQTVAITLTDNDTDSDGDGIIDPLDNCQIISNSNQLDTDDDGDGDACDDDDDGDGTPDDEDDFPTNPDEDTDTDGDGTGDNEDEDDDNDGIPDVDDPDSEELDTDGDGIPDNEDEDDDGDGTPDDEDDFPTDADEDTDTDGDGTGDNEDEDDDGDGTPDDEDDFPTDPDEDTDTDGDGIGDNEDEVNDLDSDGDGVPDTEDAFPNDPSESEDQDGDGVGANKDLDDNNSSIGEEQPIISAEAFTPNGDGINDTWVIQGIQNHPNALVTIYNRYGHEVFKTIGYQNDWSGRYSSKSENLPAGSYYYVIDLRNGTTPVNGWIFLNY